MSLVVKDARVYPAKIRNGGILRKALFGWVMAWDSMLSGSWGEWVVVLCGLVGALTVVADPIIAFSPSVSKLWLLNLIPSSILMFSCDRGLMLPVESTRRVSVTVGLADHSLGKQLADSVELLNKALPDSGLAGGAGNLLVKQVQGTLLDIGFLAETIVKGQKIEGFDADMANMQLRKSIVEVAQIAVSIEELALPRREARVKKQSEIQQARQIDAAAKLHREHAEEADKLNSEAAEKAGKLSAADQNLSALREHISEVAKAQKELTSGAVE